VPKRPLTSTAGPFVGYDCGMVGKEKIASFRKRWGLGTTDQEEVEKLKNRIVDQINEDIGSIARDAGFIKSYAQLLGKPRQRVNSALGTWELGAFATGIGAQISYAELMESAQILIWALWESGHGTQAKQFAANLCHLMELSPGFDANVLISKSEITIYPAGAKLLDESLVEEVLEWLEGYSSVGKHFYEALKIYSTKDVTKYRNLLDNLRFSLEQMLRIVLGNQKSLENQKVESLQWLASHNVHSHITNMYNDVIGRFASYQNDAVKHNERYAPVEVEFMIYLTGTFLRLLVQLHRQGTPTKNKAAPGAR
jgi:hypothetical protein